MSNIKNTNIENPDNENYGAEIQTVYVPGYTLGTDQKHKMDYYLEPRYNGINLARAVNSGYIKDEQIQSDPQKLSREYFATGKDYRTAKRNLRHNRREFTKARKYAGSDQKSAADRDFFNKLGLFTTGIIASPFAAQTIAAVPKVVTTPLFWTHGVLPILSGEVVNETTRKLSDNKYNSFGDFVYEGSGLKNAAQGTWAETPLRFITDMANPGYWVNYGNLPSRMTKGVVSLVDDLSNGLKTAQKYGFFQSSDGIPENALGMNSFRLTIPKRIRKALKERVPNLEIPGITKANVEELTYWMERNPSSREYDILAREIRNRGNIINADDLEDMVIGNRIWDYPVWGDKGEFEGTLSEFSNKIGEDIRIVTLPGRMAPTQQFLNYLDDLKYRVPKDATSWWSHPFTKMFSKRPTKYLENHPIWNKIEPWVVPTGVVTGTLIPGTNYNVWQGVKSWWDIQTDKSNVNNGKNTSSNNNIFDDDGWGK